MTLVRTEEIDCAMAVRQHDDSLKHNTMVNETTGPVPSHAAALDQ